MRSSSASRPDAIEQMLHHANELAQRIRRARFKAGSLELDFPEMKIRLDERGRISRIEKVVNDISHQLIEEFMLLANEAVAGRAHAPPASDRLSRARGAGSTAARGISRGSAQPQRPLRKSDVNAPKCRSCCRRLGTLPIGPALKIGFLKSLMRARYAVEPLGHYGLAKKKYTHFTSPIRRYADLVVHRSLFDQKAGSFSALSQIAEHISDDRAQFRRRGTRQQRREALRLPQSAAQIRQTRALPRAGHGRAQFRFLCGCARARHERSGSTLDHRR